MRNKNASKPRSTIQTMSLWCGLLTSLFCSGVALSQSFPAKPLKIIVPFPPGGTTDIIARPLSQKLTEFMGQPVVLDYRPGGNTIIGAEAMAKSAPDGYTLLLASGSTVSVNPAVYKSLPYDVVKDFAAVSEICSYALALVARPGLPANTVKELLAYAKQNPSKVTYASTGSGSPGQFGGILMESLGSVKMTHVPYKGASQAMTDIVGNQVDFILTGLSPVQPLIKAGKVKLIAIGDTKRLKAYPDLPAITETLPGYWIGTVYTLVTRSGTPRPIIDRLNMETVKALKTPEVRGPMETQGYEVPNESTPESTAKRIATELARWSKLAKETNIQLDN